MRPGNNPSDMQNCRDITVPEGLPPKYVQLFQFILGDNLVLTIKFYFRFEIDYLSAMVE